MCTNRRWTSVLVVAALSLLPTLSNHGQCATSVRADGSTVGYNNIQLVPSGIPSNLLTSFQNAVNSWNDTNCNKNGKAFPKFVQSTTAGARVINVVFQSGVGPNSSSCGNFAGNQITIYSVAYVGSQLVPCTIPSHFQDTVAHELGHTLGLGHVSGTSCPHSIMSPRQVSPSGTYTDRRVQPAECEKADDTNVTPAESNPCASAVQQMPNRVQAALINPCDEGGGEGGGPGGAGEDPGATGDGTPVILDLDGGGFRLTGLSEGVRFDLNHDGWPEHVSWTDSRTGDGWLALDRNDNGQIDDGSELFGNFTPQPPAPDPNGFLALAYYDEPLEGGNGDGVIGPEDAVFPRLKLWIDKNHDGASQPDELIALAEAGVRWIDLDYARSRHRDEHGNVFRFKSRVRIDRRMTQSYDVILLIGP